MHRIFFVLLTCGVTLMLLSCYTILKHPETHDAAYRVTVPDFDSNCLSCHETMPSHAPEYDTWWVHYQLNQETLDSWQRFQSTPWWLEQTLPASSYYSNGTNTSDTEVETPELPHAVIYERNIDLPAPAEESSEESTVSPTPADSSKTKPKTLRKPRKQPQAPTPQVDEKKKPAESTPKREEQ